MAAPSEAMENGLVPMPVSYSAGFIALSYIISAMGSATCLEMLHRRTSRSGLFNWYLLLTSSLAMGGIGIWSMHFIGNRAIFLGNGTDQDQISYNIPFTMFSLILPIVVLCAAFYTISSEEKPSAIRLIPGGFLTGGAICAMHYIGQLGISNYRCSYAVGNIVGAAIIAIASATVALTVFFRWKATWSNSWWRRMVCAAFLAGAVSGMHWTAAAGTTYRHQPGTSAGGELSRNQTVIICAALSFASCVILSICAIVAGGNRRRSKTRARQLVLSCVIFDPAGRIMVTPQALLPSRKVVDRYIGRSMKDDDFSRTHPAFLWAFRASRNWTLVKDIIPSMKRTLQNNETEIDRLIRQRGANQDTNENLHFSFDNLFKQFFCVSAQELADELRQPLSSLGELYNEVVSTATQVSRFRPESSRPALPRIGKGQLMFTVRQLSSQEEASRFMANGFRFAPIERVTATMASHIHVPSTELSAHLHEMREYCRIERGYPPGVHLVTFALRPTVHEHFEVLTKMSSPIGLPSSSLPNLSLTQADLDLISQMDDCSLTTCLKHLSPLTGGGSRNSSISSAESLQISPKNTFANHLYRAILELVASLPKNIAPAVRFSGKPLLAPCRRHQSSSDNDYCVLLCFRVVSALDTRISEPDLAFIPLKLFRVQEQVNDRAAERERFMKELNSEFSSYSAQSTANHDGASSIKPTKNRNNFLPWSFSTPKRSHQQQNHESRLQGGVSEESLVRQLSRKRPGNLSISNPFVNEIFISKEVRVDVARLDEVEMTSTANITPLPSPTMSPAAFDNTSTTSDPVERRTVTIEGGQARPGAGYVDELYRLCMGSSVRMQPGYHPYGRASDRKSHSSAEE
ncbi:putative MHYT domain signaling protein [Talaromyces proteolyticus]|uniref:MHYT domain signaling protein n=1 Tax=Talaromyces proteolyticus TaxID=1131652 RepID=A0AAD4PVE1_9EURO|nr:putative MHYT domain signaling protein [Talaromyces proteolyticus]KAH8690193.1 putative MHYT domain signaling protein [Talaromyces proteolyticus]